MAYKRVHVSELKRGQSARRLNNKGKAFDSKFDGTYVIRPGMCEEGEAWIYVYPHEESNINWSIFKEPIDEIVEVEVEKKL